MTISKDLFLSILAMDSYNQGYDSGVQHGKSQVGSALAQETPSDLDIPAWQTTGFYALSYTVGEGVDGIANGTTVIAYRGTDAAPDYTAGWSIGGGGLGHSYGDWRHETHTNPRPASGAFALWVFQTGVLASKANP